jgi:hypothetical protein
MDCSDGQLGHQFFHVNTEVSTILVGGFNPSEKYESDWIIIPTIGENKTCSKPPTRYGWELLAPTGSP